MKIYSSLINSLYMHHWHMLLFQTDSRDKLLVRPYNAKAQLSKTAHKESTVLQIKVLFAVENELSHVSLFRVGRVVLNRRGTKPSSQSL